PRTATRLQQYRSPIMDTAKEHFTASRRTATKHRPGNTAVFTRGSFTSRQLGQIGTDTGAYQTWLIHLRTGESHYTVGIQFTGGKQMTDGDHILVTHRPDSAVSAHSVQETNMSTAQTRRMRTGKFFGGFDTGGRHAGSRSFTHEQLTFGQVLQHGQAVFKGIGLFINYQRRISSERIGIHGINENGGRTTARCRNT